MSIQARLTEFPPQSVQEDIAAYITECRKEFEGRDQNYFPVDYYGDAGLVLASAPRGSEEWHDAVAMYLAGWPGQDVGWFAHYTGEEGFGRFETYHDRMRDYAEERLHGYILGDDDEEELYEFTAEFNEYVYDEVARLLDAA